MHYAFPVPPPLYSAGNVLDDFDHYMRGSRSENTAIKYVSAAQKLIEFCTMHGLAMAALPRNTLSLFSEHLVSQDLKPRSVGVYVAGARRFLAWMIDRGSAAMPNGASRVDLPKIQNELPNALKSDELLQFLSVVSRDHEPLRSAIILLAFCGLRTHEMVTLRLDSISKVNVPMKDGSASPHLCFTVRGKGDVLRVVPLLSDGAPLLMAYLTNWRRKVAGSSVWLFPAPDGACVGDRTLRAHVAQAKKIMGSKSRLTPHTLRRTYLTALWKAGVDVPTLTKIAGHKSVQTTMAHYLDIQTEDIVGAVAGRRVSLIAKGDYVDKVNAASNAVGEYLNAKKGFK